MRPDPVESLRRSMPRTWQAFFAPFAGHLLPVQLAAMPPVLAGADCLVTAPTAAGKTEAVAAPLVERALAGSWRAPAILYVSPTRALVNDLFRRLCLPLAELGVALERRTADHPHAVGRRPPAVLVTTPESLDSLLARHPAVLSHAHALVLDEVHLLEGSARGDQAAVLVARLRRLVASRKPPGHLQVVALSATVGRPEEVERRFLCDAVPASAPGSRPIALSIARWPGADRFAAALAARVAATGPRKVLLFVNRRQDAESLAGELAAALPFGGQVFAHHGSLARSVREHAEARFLSAGHAAVVATSTLELGIDIGDVDLIVLPFPPADPTAFMQRIGRGNRRTGASRVLAYARTVAERRWLRFVAECSAAGRLHPDPVPFRPSVLLQQAVSLAFQGRGHWVSAAALAGRLPGWLASSHSPDRLVRLLAGLVDGGLMRRGDHGRLHPTSELELEFMHGRVHSNIDPEEPGVALVDELTREELGRVARPREGLLPDRLRVGGRAVDVVRSGDDRIWVRGGTGGEAPVFPARPGPRKGLALCQAFRAFLGVPGVGPIMIPSGNGAAIVHFAGTLASRLLAAWIEDRRLGENVRGSGLAVRFTPSTAAAIDLPGRSDLERLVEARAGEIARALGVGPFARHLHRAEEVRFARAAVDIDRLDAVCAAGLGGGAALPEGIEFR
jgi:ATP-dependent Lhr-like helicase